MLTENNYIQELDVSENRIGTAGSNAVFAMMMENTTIERLGLFYEILAKFFTKFLRIFL